MFAAVYILASQKDGTLYIGVTSNLIQRIWEHKHGIKSGFTSRYRIVHLVWYETYEDIQAAIVREKQLKRWNRAWKIRMIEETNPTWRDLWDELVNRKQPDGCPPARA